MRKLGALLMLVGGLVILGATPAFANGFQSYRICGGDTFTSCAAVEVSVVGHNVTLRVWNLAQNGGATYNQGSGSIGVIGAIALYNLPSGLSVNAGSLLVNGSAGDWRLQNVGSHGIAIDGRTGPGHLGSGIASGCDTSAPVSALSNPCTSNLTNGWTVFSFQINGTFDPRTSEVSVLSFDPRTGQSSENWTGTTPGGQVGIATTVTPEPVTMTLLATGLAGLSGAGFLRRRRKTTDI
jgi:hypothetical protein